LPEEISLREALYNQIISDYPSDLVKTMVDAEKTEMGVRDSKELVYGEYTWESLRDIFVAIEDKYGGMARYRKFVDLGSGSGKMCVAAALLYPFESVVGIELIDCLYQISMDINERYSNLVSEAYD
jgi:tRNA G46 methylase TrmB